MELETQLLLIQRLGLVSKTDIDRVSLLLQSVLRLLRLLHRSLTKTVKMPLALKHLSTQAPSLSPPAPWPRALPTKAATMLRFYSL